MDCIVDCIVDSFSALMDVFRYVGNAGTNCFGNTTKRFEHDDVDVGQEINERRNNYYTTGYEELRINYY